MFDTHVLDETLKVKREKRNRERVDLLDRVARTLRANRQEYRIQEAYIVGSLLVDYRWHRSSDIDVVVGECSGEVLEVMKELEESTGRGVNVIDLDYHPFPDSFRRKGMKVYG